MELSRPFATVTPTLDGAVLAVLASTQEAYTIAQIRRVVSFASGEGIRKVLHRLALQGVVLHSQVGRTNTYRLNTEHLAAAPILCIAGLMNTFLHRLEEHLHAWPQPPVYAAVFGSAATGKMTALSDVDLFLVQSSSHTTEADSDSWAQQVALLTRAVTAWTGNDARVVEYTEDDLLRAAQAGEPLLRDVAMQGLTVVGSRTWLTTKLHPLIRPAQPVDAPS